MASGSGWNLRVWLAGGGCGWNLWVWLVGVVVKRYRTRRNFRGGLIFVLFAGEVDPRKLMRTKIKNYGPSP